MNLVYRSAAPGRDWTGGEPGAGDGGGPACCGPGFVGRLGRHPVRPQQLGAHVLMMRRASLCINSPLRNPLCGRCRAGQMSTCMQRRQILPLHIASPHLLLRCQLWQA